MLYVDVCRFDGDSFENGTDNVMDKSKTWSRSIEDLHGGSSPSSPIPGSISRAGRHSTLRYLRCNQLNFHSCKFARVHSSNQITLAAVICSDVDQASESVHGLPELTVVHSMTV